MEELWFKSVLPDVYPNASGTCNITDIALSTSKFVYEARHKGSWDYKSVAASVYIRVETFADKN